MLVFKTLAKQVDQLDIKHLQYFLEVAKYKSFSRAADQLFITQPTISKMIKNLEEELGIILFKRSRKQLILTDAGKVILEQAKQIDQAFHNLGTQIDQLSGLQRGHIRIGLPPIFDAKRLLKIIGLFHEQHPGITFQLVENGSKKIEEAVETNLLDLGVVVLPTNNETFDYFPFIEEDLKLIIPTSHRFAYREQVELEELAEESFILFNKDFVLNDRILLSCNNAGFHPTVISESTQQVFIEQMVANKLGIALLPESVCRHLPKNIRSIEVINPKIRWKLAVIWRKNQYLSFAAKEWLRFTKHHLHMEEEELGSVL